MDNDATLPVSDVFDRIEKKSIADRVFDSLRKEILKQTFQVGDKLPSEGSLSRQFGVSKASVKMALQRLATLGLIETRVGQGSFVREFDPNDYLSLLQEFLFSSSNVVQMSEYRFFMEMVSTRLAIKRGTPENFSKMENIIDQMEEAARQNNMELEGKLDYQFHLEICKATGNEIFVLAYEIIGKMIRRHSEFAKQKYSHNFTEGEQVHRRLMEAIKAGNIEACRSCYREMFSVTGLSGEEDEA
jgi:GntR family transcriptional repressor for pyruvate dehydrogenase complex